MAQKTMTMSETRQKFTFLDRRVFRALVFIPMSVILWFFCYGISMSLSMRGFPDGGTELERCVREYDALISGIALFTAILGSVLVLIALVIPTMSAKRLWLILLVMFLLIWPAFIAESYVVNWICSGLNDGSGG